MTTRDPRVAVVTGASSGIGLAVARRFAALGDRVVMLARTPERLDQAAASVRRDASGPDPLVLPSDVRDTTSLESAFGQIGERLGSVDVLCPAAGVLFAPTPVEDLDDAQWDEAIDVNLSGTFRAVRAAWPLLSEGACVITFGSVMGPIAAPGIADYTAAKGGIAALTRALAAEGAQRGIRANMVVAGLIDTPMTHRQAARSQDEAAWFRGNLDRIPLGRCGQPEEVAAAVAYLAGPDAGFITGAELRLDGGVTLGAAPAARAAE